MQSTSYPALRCMELGMQPSFYIADEPLCSHADMLGKVLTYRQTQASAAAFTDEGVCKPE